MKDFRIGVVGTGFIARMISKAIGQSQRCRLVACSSRSRSRAETFVAEFPGVQPVEGVQSLVSSDEVDAVYVATPTHAKEEVAMAAAAHGKHVLVDKPFASVDSARRIAEAARHKGLHFMDATHFVHHPRTQAVRDEDRVGIPLSLHTAFHFPSDDPTNIRFDPEQEPLGALGDMGWYSIRAALEYLQPEGSVADAAVVFRRDPRTHAIVQVCGHIMFEDDKVTTFDVGYTAGAMILDLELIGTQGVLTMNDFVMDSHSSILFQGEAPCAYGLRQGIGNHAAPQVVEVPNEVPAHVRMLDAWAAGEDRTETTLANQFALDLLGRLVAP